MYTYMEYNIIMLKIIEWKSLKLMKSCSRNHVRHERSSSSILNFHTVHKCF